MKDLKTLSVKQLKTELIENALVVLFSLAGIVVVGDIIAKRLASRVDTLTVTVAVIGALTVCAYKSYRSAANARQELLNRS